MRQEIKYDSKTNRGLAGIGAEALDKNSVDIKETYNIGFENPNAPNKITKNPLFNDFNKAVIEYMELCYRNMQDLLRALALGCDLEENFFVNKHNEESQPFRFSHYPVIKGNKKNMRYPLTLITVV